MAGKLNKNKVIATAQKHVHKGNLDRAIREYRKIVEEDPRDVRVWLKIGDLFAKKGARHEAVDTYSKVAEFYSEQGFYLKAVAVYKQILRINPKLVDVNLRLAELYKQLGLLSDAMRQYEQVSSFFYTEGRIQEALDALKQTINLDPANVASRIKLAELYSKEEMDEQAVEEFSKAADYLKASNRTDDYIKVAERLIFHQKDNLAVIKELARVYLQRRDGTRALQKLQLAFRLDPRDIETLELLAETFQGLNQEIKTVSVLKELGRLHEELGDREKLHDIYHRILQLQPDDTEIKKALRRLRQSVISQIEQVPGSVPGATPPPVPVPPPAVSSSLPTPPRAPVVSPSPLPMPPRAPVSSPSPQPAPRPSSGGPQSWPAGGHRQQVSSTVIPAVPETLPEPEPMVTEMEQGDHFEGSFNIPGPNGRLGSAQWDSSANQRVPGRSPLPSPREIPVVRSRSETGESQPSIRRDTSVNTVGSGFVQKVISEAEVYIKYGLQDKAIEHLEQVFEHDAYNVEVRVKLKELYVQMKQYQRAARELLVLAQHVVNTNRRLAADLLNEALDLDPENRVARELLQTIEGSNVNEQIEPSRDELDTGEIPEEPMPEANEFYMQDQLDREQDGDPPAYVLTLPDEQTGGWEMDLGEQETADPSDLQHVAPPSAEVPAYAEDEEEEIVVDTGMDFPAVQLDPTQAPEISSPDSPVHQGSGHHDLTGGIEDDLEEAEFFMQQSLFSEARAILMDLLRRFPGHPLIEAKMAEMELAEEENRSQIGDQAPLTERQGLDVHALSNMPEPEPEPEPAPPSESKGTDLSVEDVFKEFSRDAESSLDGDSDTHYDLGIAYREMGLMDDAINEFTVAMSASEKRALCRTMIGLCHMDKSDYNEAVNQFKKGLKVEGIQAQEVVSLYYELGNAYELMDDQRQALYYYRKVANKAPRFREVTAMIDKLRSLVDDVE